jgi:hypothetical protein
MFRFVTIVRPFSFKLRINIPKQARFSLEYLFNFFVGDCFHGDHGDFLYISLSTLLFQDLEWVQKILISTYKCAVTKNRK